MSDDSAAALPKELPLVVDLDGTLLRTDVLYESLARLLHANPLYVLLLPIWLARGRANLKRQIAMRVSLDVETLPYRQDFLSYLKDQASAGRALVLATTADASIAERVAGHLGIFSAVLASDGVTNLKGRTKAVRVQTYFGERPFAYAGNDWSDVPVWRVAHAGVVVTGSQRLAEHVRSITPIERLFSPAASTAAALISALRVDQWVKNLLVFVPLAAAHRLDEPMLIAQAGVAFVAFSLAASAGYIVNDIGDLESDRLHAQKRNRPFASGRVDIRVGLLAIAPLVIVAIALAALVSAVLALVVLGYFVSAQLYTFLLKKIAIADVFALAVLYAARIVAGAVAVAVPISQWLLAFSVFFFLCLAFIKRYSEVHAVIASEQQRTRGRGYLVTDFGMLSSLGAASGFISVLVLALYINSPEVTALYRTPEALWLVCLVLLYWLSRLWMVAHRGWMTDDPIVFALKDRTSYAAGALCLVAFVAAWA